MIIELILCALAVGFGGSGAIRAVSAKDRHFGALASYNSILHRIETVKSELEVQLEKLGKCADVAFATVRRANKILEPLQHWRSSHVPTKYEVNGLTVLSGSTSVVTSYSVATAALTGGVAGMALVTGSWTAVSMLGTASTGVAISSLHGVAATNAALAWFGAGSLTTGGGGILAGKLVLGSVALLPMAALAGIALHWKASEIEDRACKLEAANTENRTLITKLEDRKRSMTPLLHVIVSDTTVLSSAVSHAEERLYRFGVISRIYKYFRYHVRGYYYSSKEMIEVEALGRAVDKFNSHFRTTPAEGRPRLLSASPAESL